MVRLSAILPPSAFHELSMGPRIEPYEPLAHVSPPPGRGRTVNFLNAVTSSSRLIPRMVRYIHSDTEPNAKCEKEFIPESWKPEPSTCPSQRSQIVVAPWSIR